MIIMTWLSSWIVKLLALWRHWRRRPAAHEDTEATPRDMITAVVPPIQTPADADLPPESSVTGNRDMEPPIDNVGDVDEREVIEDRDQRNNAPATGVHVHGVPQSPINPTTPNNNQPTTDQVGPNDVGPSQTSSQNSQDNIEYIASAEEQLLSIPSDDNSAARLPDRPTTPFPEERPISLSELVEYVSPDNLFKHLPIRDVISTRMLDQFMRTRVDEYFLHRLLPYTEITFRSNYLHSIEGRLERESETLTPVIQRIDKEKRFLPHGRVLFEPSDRNPPYYYWHGRFKPVAVDFRLPDGTTYTWDLIPTADTNSLPYRNDRRTAHLLTIPVFKHKKIYQYYKFETFKDSPAQVFYKDRVDSDAPGFRLHALSFPLKWLQQALYNEVGIHKSNGRGVAVGTSVPSQRTRL